MMNKWNLESWLAEFDIPALGGQPDMPAGQAPATGMQGMQPAMEPQLGTNDPNMALQDPNVTNQPDSPPGGDEEEEEDISMDPEAPDMPEERGEEDFETWRNEYFKESIKGDTNELMDMLLEAREWEGLEAHQRKFIEDNLNIQFLRQNANIEKACKEIRKMIREQLDRNNPATSVAIFMTDVLETVPQLNNIFVKLNGYSGLKGDLHRKFIASLLGGVQVGSGANNEDVIYNSRDYSIMMSTRFNAQWGDVALGNWSLREDDAERYLTEPERRRLQEGSPEERDVLRRRIVVESIAKQYETRAFLVNVVSDEGAIYTLGWDLSHSILGAYTDGHLVVRTRHSNNLEAMIDDEGNIVPLIDLNINFVRQTGEQDEEGQPAVEELKFMERRNGMLFLTANLQTLNDAATALQGMVLKEVAYRGNPSDLRTLVRCVYSAHDLLMRQC